MVHSARWDPSLTPETMKGLEIALIGAGSTGIQILPQIQPFAKRVDHYMSSKTWISPIGFGSEELEARNAIGNCRNPLSHLLTYCSNYLWYSSAFLRRIAEISG